MTRAKNSRSRSRSRSRKRSVSSSRGRKSNDPVELELSVDEFMVTVELSGKTRLGLDVDWCDGRTLYIKKVMEGAVENYNRRVTDDLKLVAGGDRVIAVNNVFDEPQVMLNEVRKGGKLKLLIRMNQPKKAAMLAALEQAPPTVGGVPAQELPANLKPEEFTIVLDSARSGLLGVDVDWGDGSSMYIKAVVSGSVDDWNRTCQPHRVVYPGDRIVAVNGYSDNPEAMAGLCRELCSAQCRFLVRIKGPPPPPPLPSKGFPDDVITIEDKVKSLVKEGSKAKEKDEKRDKKDKAKKDK